MKNWVLFSFLFCLLCVVTSDYCVSPSPNPSVGTENKKLLFAYVIVRHGDRTPIYALPNPGKDDVQWKCSENTLNLFSENFDTVVPTPNRLYRRANLQDRNVLPGNCALGQLTEIGLQQHFEKGKDFRDLYVAQYGLLGEEFDENKIWVRSTDIPRTIQSGMAHLWSMFPPSAQKDSTTPVIQINTLDLQVEDSIPNPNLCPALSTLWNQMAQRPEWKQKEAECASLKQYLQQIFNTSISWTYLMDNLISRQCHGLSYPPGINQSVVDEIVDINTWQQVYTWTDPLAARLGMGPLLGEIYEQLLSAYKGNNGKSYVLHIAHDTTVGPLAALLGMKVLEWPPLASHMEFELWQDVKGSFYVQTKYNGESIVLQRCSSEMCDWESWQRFITSKIPDPNEYAQGCQL